MLNTISEYFLKALADAYGEGVSKEALTASIGPAFEKARPEIGRTFLTALKRNSQEMLAERRQATAGFEQRNFERWREAFDLFEMLLEIATELGEEHDKDSRPLAIQELDYKFEAIAHIHPKAVLVGRELFCLLKAGYPDAAMSRWRTLFEFSVVALFLKEGDQNTALRYLASADFKALRAAKEHNRYAERLNLEPYSSNEMYDLEMRAAQLEGEIGCRLKKDYDWAHPALLAKFPSLKSDRVDFVHLQEAVRLDHWRPYFRWANQHVHAGHRAFSSLLGACESLDPIALVGPSNSGFVDPLSLGAMSLINVAAVFLMTNFNLDRAIMVDVLFAIGDEIGPLALRLEEDSLSKARAEPIAK